MSAGARWLASLVGVVVIGPLAMLFLGTLAFVVVVVAGSVYSAPLAVQFMRENLPDLFPERDAQEDGPVRNRTREAVIGGLTAAGVLLVAALAALLVGWLRA